MRMRCSIRRLHVTASVWLLRSSDQYDFTSSYKRTVTLTVRGSAALYQRGSEVFAATLGQKVEGRLIAIVVAVKGSAVVLSPQEVGEETEMWRVVKEVQKHASLGQLLSEGDIIRFGSTHWEITEISVNEVHSTEQSELTTPLPEVLENLSRSCKICLGSESNPINPLISPCACKGSVQYVHVNCLDSWIGSQRRKEEKKYDKKYLWKSVQCSVCKSALSQEIETSEGKFHNLGVPKPSISDYMIVRNIDSHDPEIHIWQWNRHHSLSIGTGASNKIQVSRSNISDEHALLKVRKGQVYLQDHNSQYGTYVLVQSPINIVSGEKVSVLCGNVLLNFTKKEKCSLLRCFSLPKMPPAEKNELVDKIAEAQACWRSRS